MYDYIIKQNLPCIIIANKADKIAITKVDDSVKLVQDALNPLHDLTFMPFSSERIIHWLSVTSEWREQEPSAAQTPSDLSVLFSRIV